MKIDQAIKILKNWETDSDVQIDEGLDDALQLGIEALERIRSERRCPDVQVFRYLPSEIEKKK